MVGDSMLDEDMSLHHFGAFINLKDREAEFQWGTVSLVFEAKRLLYDDLLWVTALFKVIRI